jgi:hypothetical protein
VLIAGPLEEADEYGYHPAMRVKNWVKFSHYDGKACEGKVIRGICVYGIRKYSPSGIEMRGRPVIRDHHFLGQDGHVLMF